MDSAVDIRTQQMRDFEASLPGGFYDAMSQKVVTMEASKKHVKIDGKTMINTELLFSRAIGLQGSSREAIDVKEVLTYKLAPGQLQCLQVLVT